MPATLKQRRCVMVRETPTKRVYAVVIAMDAEFVWVARGTKNGTHSDPRIIPEPITPGSVAAMRWQNPTITVDTFFYVFDIRRVEAQRCEPSGGFCADDLWEAILSSWQHMAPEFESG